jgi:hypothetical protein
MYQMLFSLSDKVGICGVSFILIAYFMLSMGKWTANQLIYQLFNFSGAWLILFSLYFHWNLSSVLIEIAWIMISLVGLYKKFEKRFIKRDACLKHIIDATL